MIVRLTEEEASLLMSEASVREIDWNDGRGCAGAIATNEAEFQHTPRGYDISFAFLVAGGPDVIRNAQEMLIRINAIDLRAHREEELGL